MAPQLTISHHSADEFPLLSKLRVHGLRHKRTTMECVLRQLHPTTPGTDFLITATDTAFPCVKNKIL
jgi:hypothetical protein